MQEYLSQAMLSLNTKIHGLEIKCIVFCLLFVGSPTSFSAEEEPVILGARVCGTLRNAFGPFDYRTHKNSDELWDVETNHFTRDVENLVRSTRGGSHRAALADIDYLLRAFPNHHRGLFAVSRYQLKYGIPQNSRFRKLECYFDRAIRFAPDDGMVRMIYGIYLQKKGSLKGALSRYNEALKLMPNSAEVHYNLGLLYVKLKDYKAAKKHADKAYQIGYPLPGLKQQLIRLGVWKKK